ncbi:hypothetical protein [Vibrio sp. TBV020]|uniref:hypothetical protein n=1 Tax=Vibrio sp. TBV020 TaxID=3137398 RepID=UPI0038CDAAA0
MKLRSSVFLFTSILSTGALASVESQITDIVTTWFDVEVKKVKSLAVRASFDCEFYSGTPTINTTDGSSSFGDHYFLHSNGKVEAIVTPSTTQPLPQVTQCIKKDLVISNTEEAEVVLEALGDIFHAMNSSFREVEPHVIRKETHWELINDKFFDDYSGYIVKTAPDGTVKSISYSLELKGQ